MSTTVMFPSLLRLLTKYLFSDEFRYITNLIASMVKDRFAKGQVLIRTQENVFFSVVSVKRLQFLFVFKAIGRLC